VPQARARTGPYVYAHPRPMVTVDAVVFTVEAGELQVLLIRRRNEPFQGRWALPGGFVDMDEPLEAAVRRELAEETGLEGLWLEQLYTFGQPDRDPRGRVITVAYLGLIASERMHQLAAGDDAEDATWWPAAKLPAMAFDHGRIVRFARQHLQAQLACTTVAFELLPRRFTLSQLQAVYEAILARKLDKRNFRRKMLSRNVLRATGATLRNGAHRPARLYRPASGTPKRAEGHGLPVPLSAARKGNRRNAATKG